MTTGIPTFYTKSDMKYIFPLQLLWWIALQDLWRAHTKQNPKQIPVFSKKQHLCLLYGFYRQRFLFKARTDYNFIIFVMWNSIVTCFHLTGNTWTAQRMAKKNHFTLAFLLSKTVKRTLLRQEFKYPGKRIGRFWGCLGLLQETIFNCLHLDIIPNCIVYCSTAIHPQHFKTD